MDIDRVFILLFAAWGILATCFAIWQSKYTRRYPPRCECGCLKLVEMHCPRCKQ